MVVAVRGAAGGVMAGNYYHRFEHLAPYITLATDGTGEREKHPRRGLCAPAVWGLLVRLGGQDIRGQTEGQQEAARIGQTTTRGKTRGHSKDP